MNTKSSNTPQVVKLEDYAPSAYLISETRLLFQLDPKRTLVTAELTIDRREGTPEDAPLVLDGDELETISIAIDGKALAPGDYDLSPDSLTLTNLPRTTSFKLLIQTAINPSANSKLMGLYLSNGVICTQCEAEGFRRITWFLDRPDVLSTYTVRLEADRKAIPTLLSNGNLVEAGALDDGRHFAVWHDPFPKPSYLFALVGGDLARIEDRFTTASGREVALAIHVEHGKTDRATYAMDALKRSMRWDETAWGREYDLDVFNIVAVSDFNIGAMENKGLNIFNDKFILADSETATDTDFANIEAIVAHEYFHNWTGNRITCRDWFQLCLKEGLTVYRDHEFSADERSRGVKRVQDVRALKAQQFPEDQGPLAHPVRPRRYREINNFYTPTVYEKGAEVIGMLRTLLGPETFRSGMDLYFERHDGEAVTIEDFLKVFEDASGQDLSQFSLWYHQAGTPQVVVHSDYDARSGIFTVEIEQSLAPTPPELRKRRMHIPLAFGLVGPNGEEMVAGGVTGARVENGVIHLTTKRHRIHFSKVAARPVLSINRGFSAPVQLVQPMGEEDQLFLARRDPDQFGRWQAATTVLTETLIKATRPNGALSNDTSRKEVAALLGEIAADENLEHAYRALVLSLPTEADIAREIGAKIDPDAILIARETLLAEAGEANRADFAKLYDRLQTSGPFSPDAESAGRRALRNVLLEYLCADGTDPSHAADQFELATNLTDRLAALTVLVHRHAGAASTIRALNQFQARYAENPLVMDKWFQVQATAPHPQSVEHVRALMKHKAFSLSNPNRVRALIAAFASGNQTGFHRADGGGYRLLGEVILEVDPLNPHLSARLAKTFRSWRAVDANRQQYAREVLVGISRTPGISRDLSEIVDQTLG